MLDFRRMLPAFGEGLLVIIAVTACQSIPIPPTAAPLSAIASPTALSSPSPSATASPVTPSPTETPSPTSTAGRPAATPTLDPAGLPAMRIAFIGADAEALMGDSRNLWVMDADGSDRRLVAHVEPGGDLGGFGAFSPDGCFYAVTDAGQAAVFDLQTGEKVVVDRVGPDEPLVMTNFTWSVDSATLTYYRGGAPESPQTAHLLRQVERLADGSWSEPRTIVLDLSGRVMLPVWALEDGRILTQTFGAGPGRGPVANITDLTTGKTRPLSRPGSDQPVDVTDVTPDGHIVFETWRTDISALPDPNIYTGRITASGAIADVVTIAPPEGLSWVFAGKLTPDRKGVLAVVQAGLHGEPKDYGLFSPLGGGTIRYTPLLPAQPSIMGHSPLGAGYAVASVVTEGVTVSDMTGTIWLVALDGSLRAALGDGYYPVALPVCQK